MCFTSELPATTSADSFMRSNVSTLRVLRLGQCLSMTMMSGSNSALLKRPRDAYSRLICLGCRQRRIRCELPSGVEIPRPGELRPVQTPCYRCKKLGIPCVVRRTVLGRPSSDNSSTSSAQGEISDVVSRIIVELPSRTGPTISPDTVSNGAQSFDRTASSQGLLQSHNSVQLYKKALVRWNEDALLIRIPQSSETVVILRALDTIRCEDAEEAWPRHLPVRTGHTEALDLSIKAIVAACAYARGVPKLTLDDCYQALIVALSAIHAKIKQSAGQPSDDVLASTALLAPFDGVLKKHDTPTRLHVEGLAAILAARPATFPVTQLAREIFDYYACDSTIMACIRGTPSAFESVARTYFVNDREGHCDGDRAQLKAIGNELLISIPRLVGLVRSLRNMSSFQRELFLDTLRFLKSLLGLQDGEAESRLLTRAIIRPVRDSDSPSSLCQSVHFTSVEDFEALTCYWHSRLALLRLEWCIHDLIASIEIQDESADRPEAFPGPSLQPRAMIKDDMIRLVNNILMCSQYAKKLRLRKRRRLFAQALVAVWGAISDTSMTRNNDKEKEQASAWLEMVLRGFNDVLTASPSLTIGDMDTAADIFIGGRPSVQYRSTPKNANNGYATKKQAEVSESSKTTECHSIYMYIVKGKYQRIYIDVADMTSRQWAEPAEYVRCAGAGVRLTDTRHSLSSRPGMEDQHGATSSRPRIRPGQSIAKLDVHQADERPRGDEE
nr:hypothetical protein CFP56_46844 [Quercus suber]POE87637.1 hypothetical protein CFP56_30226 [Quercus suber]